jgi:hypothetical protein
MEKSRAKKGSSWGQTSKGEKRKDFSKVKCFVCRKPGHYASQCPTKKEVYIEQPEGFEVQGRDSHLCKLKKALYGLKQAPRAWYSRIDNYLQGMGFTKSEADSNLYYIIVGGEPLILVLYVDDLFLTGSEKLIAECKRDLASEYEMKDLGLMHYFVGVRGVAERWIDFLGTGKVCSGGPEEVWDAGLQAYVDTNGDQLEED